MNSIGCFVWRNGVAIAIAAEQLRITDLVLTTTGHYVPAVEITRLREGTLRPGADSRRSEWTRCRRSLFGSCLAPGRVLQTAVSIKAVSEKQRTR